MPLTTTNQVQGRTWAGYSKRVPVYGNWPASSFNVLNAGVAASLMRRGAFLQGPPSSLETGVSGGYLLTKIQIVSTLSVPFTLAEIFDMGTVDLATGIFTDGVAAPSRKQGGGSATTLPLWPILEIDTTTASTATRTLRLGYTDMSGNAKVTTAPTIAASSSKWSCGVPILASGDLHVQDITSAVCTGGSSPSGIVRVWGLSPIYDGLLSPGAAAPNINVLNEGVVARVPAGAKVGLFVHTNSALAMQGTVTWVGDTP